MPNDNSYIDAIIIETPRIMGIKLRPLSIGHYLLMKKYQSNFVADEPAEPTLDDLTLSIAICARKYDEFLDFMSNVNCLRWAKKWGKQVNKEVKGNPLYILEKKKEFSKYLIEGMKVPKYWLLVEQDGASNSGKLVEHMITTLQGELGYTRDEVLNVPFTQAIYDYFLFLESKGIIQLMSDDDLKLLEASNGKA